MQKKRMDAMLPKQEINSLIDAGWRVIESDFSEEAFIKWRKEALKCLTLLCGPQHPYTDLFESKILEAARKDILVGVGVLTAADSDHSIG